MAGVSSSTAAALAARRAELRSAIARRDRIAIERHPDPADNIGQLVDREISAGELEQLARQLAAVEAALERLRAGTFGLCLDCGDEIPARRLAAVPWAFRCVACQQAFEAEAASRGAEWAALEEVRVA